MYTVALCVDKIRSGARDKEAPCSNPLFHGPK